MDHTTKLACTVPEAAKSLGISRSRLYELMSEGKLSRRKIGKRTLILTADLQRFVESLPTE